MPTSGTLDCEPSSRIIRCLPTVLRALGGSSGALGQSCDGSHGKSSEDSVAQHGPRPYWLIRAAMPRMCRAIRRSSDEPAQRRQTIDNRCIEGSDFNANRLTIPRVVRNLWVTPPIPDADVDEEPRLLDDMSDGCHRDGEYSFPGTRTGA